MSETWRREFKGALVSFGDGAVVTKVSFPSDFSAVRISHLPPYAPVSFVLNLLASRGFVVSEDCVRIPVRADNTYCSAEVRVEDPQFAKRLSDSLSTDRRDAPKAIPIPVPMPQTTNYGRVDSKKVYCSWHKPSKTAWLNFGNRDIAAKVGSSFSAGQYKVLNQRVECEGPIRGAGHRNPLAWSIRLSGIPRATKKDDITRALPGALAARHIEMSNASYDVDLQMANRIIESLLLQAGPLEWWEGGQEGPGKRFKGKARFMTDTDARQAVKLFHNKPLSFNTGGKLTVQLVHTARLKISADVYDTVEQELAEFRQICESQHLLYVSYPPVQRFRVLKIEGEICHDVARAKATLEKIINGEVVMQDGKAIWAPSFAANGSAYGKIKQLERELGILIIRDKRRSQLRVLGSQPRRKEAQLALAELAVLDSSPVFVIELNAQQFSWAFQGGYRAITAAIGDDKVILDIASSPQRILVVGSEADLKTAQDFLRCKEQVSEDTTESESMTDCAICWTEAENAVRTTCKHIYCSGCFEDLCFAGVNSGTCIRCQGDAGQCSEILLLTELQAHLSSSALEDILEAACITHINRHPLDLQYCPTPDCGQIYRAENPHGHDNNLGETNENRLFICPACLVTICRACKVSHDGMTCVEYRDHISGGYQALQAVKKELGIKNCPKCDAMIEKTFGCNHMTCSGCGAHICWVCMKTFLMGHRVYEHMTREHGGIGVPYYPGLA